MRKKQIGWAIVALSLCVGLGCEDDARDTKNNTAGSGGAGAGAAGTTAGSGASAMPSAVATIAPFDMGMVTGTATFTQSGTDVTVVVSLSNCPDGMHGVHIHQGTSCADATMQGGHWDMTRGEGIPAVMCANGTGTAMLTRNAMDPTLAWSVGGAAATNVIGHAFVVHNPGDPAPRIGCGLIAAK
jgi:Cu-Zn family superoxide dismutase